MRTLLFCLFAAFSFAASAQTTLDLIGLTTPNGPRYVQTFHNDQTAVAALNANTFGVDGSSADLYIVAHRSDTEWNADPSLTDVRGGGFQTVDFEAGGVLTNTFVLADFADLAGDTETRPGFAYDVVFDLDQNGELGPSDVLDGGGDLPGFFVVGDMLQPGPHAVVSSNFVESAWHTFDVYYPEGIASLSAQPLVVISHGWTHEYWYYDHLGEHLASYGYVVISHRNDVGNGGAAATQTASQTALENIDSFLGNLENIDDGVLQGKVNSNLIVHTGHSTGGECVVRAYKRLFDGDYISPYITHQDIVCVSSLAPVSFLDAEATHPEGSNYHIFFCGADTDVSGVPTDTYKQGMAIYERGYGNKQVTYIHGAGHEDLHNNPGDSWADGPNLIGREATHTIVKPYALALCELYARNNLAMKDYFTRNRQEFRPSGIASELVITGEYRDAVADAVVVDDFQTNTEDDVSSSGGEVVPEMEDYFEILMRDTDGSLEWTGGQWSNGMCRARYDDEPRCAVMTWQGAGEVNYTLEAEEFLDLQPYNSLSFRAAQLTRHPYNSASPEGLTFRVQLVDENMEAAVVNCAPYGPVLPPYPRGQGGLFGACLPEGSYDITVGGGGFDEEILFSIPGYFENQPAGAYTLEIGQGDPCTELDIIFFDSWGDGWNGALMTISFTNASGETEVVFSETLINGTGGDASVGWQNEFHIYRIPLQQFTDANPNLDLSDMDHLTFQFGEEGDSPQGALALDNIEFSHSGLSYVASVHSEETQPTLLPFPNPAHTFTAIDLPFGGVWKLKLFDRAGRLVSEQQLAGNRAVLDVRALENGVYAVQASQNTAVLNGRVMVIH